MKHYISTIIISALAVTFTVPFVHYMSQHLQGESPVEEPQDTRVYTDKIVITTPVTEPPPTDPVVIQIEHQGFPFDVDGNFQYVVTIDNTVYRYDKKIVSDFLQHAVWAEEQLGEKERNEAARLRRLSTN